MSQTHNTVAPKYLSFKSWALLCVAILTAIPILMILTSFIPYQPAALKRENFQSVRIYDRNHILLREILSDEQHTARWIPIKDLDPSTINAFISAEDKRFFKHPGFDPLALSRSVKNAIVRRSISSGASTITQQLIRIIHHYPRNFATKLYEIWLAVRLEQAMSKSDILEHYLNRAPLGNLCFGIGAASYTYFKRSPTELTTAEAAFIAAILKSPSLYNPYRHYEKTLSRQKYILHRMYENGYLNDDQYSRFLNQTVTIEQPDVAFRAPHFCDRVVSYYLAQSNDVIEITTTLDYNLQKNIEYFVRGRIKDLLSSNARQSALLILDNASSEIITWIGSVDYFDENEAGQVDGVISRRQPGSTLKPFTYGLALQAGMTPATIIPDIQTYSNEISGYFTPDNYDNRFHGPVTIRRALACSYNVPPVRVLESIGEANLLELLHRAGFHSLDKPPRYYGKGLTLGNGEVRLLELVRAYAAFTRGGTVLSEKFIISQRHADGSEPWEIAADDTIGTLFDKQICALLLDILSDNNARIPAFGRYNPLHFPFQCAAKTGTSKDYRDNWVVGCTPEVTVGVWVGNFNGEPMRQVSGISGAGPIFNDVMFFLDKYYHFSSFTIDATLDTASICPLSGRLVSHDCPASYKELFVPGTAPRDTCTWHKMVTVDDRTVFQDSSTYQPYPDLHRGKRQLFLDLPSIYYPWMIENNIPFIPAQSQTGKETSARSLHAFTLKILAPLPDEIYKIDSILRRNYQQISLKADIPSSVQQVEWFVDDKLYATLNHPFIARWPLQEGVHEFYVRAGDLMSDRVSITVLPPD